MKRKVGVDDLSKQKANLLAAVVCSLMKLFVSRQG
jgi:hypothetical protein